MIRQCFRLSETQLFHGCIKAAGGGRNQSGKLKLHKGCERRGCKGMRWTRAAQGEGIKMVARIRKTGARIKRETMNLKSEEH